MSDVAVVEGISDHEAVIAKMNFKAKVNIKKPRKVLLFGKANKDMIQKDLEKLRDYYIVNGMQKSASEEWEHIKLTIMKTVNSNIPTKFLKPGKDLPWMSKRIKRLIKKKSKKIQQSKKVRK